MKKGILALSAVTLLIATGCNKKDLNDAFWDEVTSEEAHLRLDNSSYEIEIVEPLYASLAMDYYTSGVVNYKLDGETVANS